MGLFSRKKTYISTSVSRVVEDNSIPESTKSAMMRALIENESLSDEILESQVNSSVFKFEQMYRHAKAGNYVHGLPSGRAISETGAVPVAQSVLESLLGAGVSIDYLRIGEAIPKHFGKQYAFDNLGFDRNTGKLETLSAEKGTPVYLKKIMTLIPVDSADDIDFSIVTREIDIEHREYHNRTVYELNQERWQALKDVAYIPTSQDVFYVTDGSVPYSARVHWIWEQTDKDGNTSVAEDWINVPIPDSTFENSVEYYHIGYTRGGNYGYWTYEIGTGTHPTLDNYTEVQYTADGTYFPFALFISDYANKALQTGTAEFESTETLLKKIGIDYNQLGAAIEENPDIGDVITSAMIMAVPLNTTNVMEGKYLFDYFDRLQASTTNKPVTLNQYQNVDNNNNAITWSDLDFSLTLTYHGIYSATKSGTLGEVGHHQIDKEQSTLEYTVEVGGDNVREETRTRTYWTYHIKRQITPNLYRVVSVVNPIAQYPIDYKRTYYSTRDNDILLVPLDYELCRTYTIDEREILYHRALHMVFNAKKVVKLKWYETGFFRFILTAAAIVITVVSFGKGSPLIATVQALTAMGLTYLAIAVVLVYVAGFALKVYAFRLLAKELDPDVFAIVALAAIAYGGYKGLAGETTTAMDYVRFGANMLELNQAAIQREMDAIVNQNKELIDLQNEQESEIEEILKTLESPGDLIDPMSFIGKSPRIINGETPDDFFSRTIHMGSTADLSYKSIEHYVNVSLKLPTIG